jgi:hypothetical protein
MIQRLLKRKVGGGCGGEGEDPRDDGGAFEL